MNISVVKKFESHLVENLGRCGVELAAGGVIGCGVSGGADSVSLLSGLVQVCRDRGVHVVAVTVDHNIRSAEESGGDSAFVADLCRRFAESGFDVECVTERLEPGAVTGCAELRGNGVEEAARFLRYEIFERVCAERGILNFCLAHNKNDQIETLLMRFLQGSGTGGLCGIGMRRGIFVRPLLDVERALIEEYLVASGLEWRTDATNFDVHYLRNRIRNVLVPFLNENFYGFDKALFSGAEKAALDEGVLRGIVNGNGNFWQLGTGCKKGGDEICCSGKEFVSLGKGLCVRQIYAGLGLLGLEGGKRVPFSLIKRFVDKVFMGTSKAFSECACGLVFCFEKGFITIKKQKLIATESVFFVIIEEDKDIMMDGFELCARVSGDSAKVVFSSETDCVALENIPVPFCVRSRQPGDFVQTAGGGSRSVSDVLSDWHAGVEKKNSIPVVQELCSPGQKIVAVVGSIFGFENWTVKG